MVNELQRALRKGLVPKDEVANVQAQIAKLDAQIKTYVPNGKMGGTFWQKLIGSDTTTTREARARIIETGTNRENAESRVKEKRAELEGKQEDVQSNISRLSELLLGSVGEGKRRYDENTVVIAELSEKQENGTISPDEYNELERARTENQDLEQNNEIVKLTSVIAKNNELIATKRADRDANNAAINENQTKLETETNLSEEERAALMAAIDLLNAQNQDIETAISTLGRDNVEQYATLTTSANSLVTEQVNSNIGTMEQQQEEVSALEDKVSKGEATDEERVRLDELKDSNQSLIDANKTLEATLQELIASMMGVETSNKELVDAEQESSKATKDDIKAKKDGANATKGQKKIDAKGGLDMAQQAVGGAAGLMSKMGIESEGATAAMGIMSGAMDTAAKFMEGDFVGAAMSAISTLLDIGSLFGGISDANYVEDMEKLTTSNEVLRDSIDKLSEKMDKQSAVEANKTYEQQKVMFNESLKNTREQLKRTYEVSSSAWFSGYHSVAYNIDRNMDQSTKDLFNKYFGGVGAMFDADYEKVSDILTQNSAMLSGLRNAAKDSEWGEDFLGYVDEFLAYSDQWNKIEKNRQQTILGFSFDSLSQNFRDNLKNMESATSNWGKSTADRLREMQIKQYTTTEDYQKKRDAIDNKYLEYIKDDKLTRAEVQDILTQEKKLASELNAQVRNWEDETGIDREYDDTASSRSLKGMSEDTANELNGRFTAMQISLQQQVVNQATLLANVTSINSVLYQCNAALEGIATQQALATQHLEDINERQKKYYIDFANYMEKIEQNTDRL